MPEWIMALVLISSGIGLGLFCFVVGAWIMFKAKSQPGTGESFLQSPKGEVFSISDGLDDQFSDEPSGEEKSILKKTERFLKVLGGE